MVFADHDDRCSWCAVGHSSQFVVLVDAHATVVGDGAGHDGVDVVEQLRESQPAVLPSGAEHKSILRAGTPHGNIGGHSPKRQREDQD